jgi:YfiH family protein
VSAPAARPAIPEREVVAEFAKIGITAFTTTRALDDFAIAEPTPSADNLERWKATQRSLQPAPCGLVSARQVHATSISEQKVSWNEWRRLDGFDAHIVTAPVGAAAVTVADCVPVFIAHPSGAVAIVHAGWRGVAAKLLPKTVAQLAIHDLRSPDLAVHLGPAICGRCYEVGPDVYEQLTGWQTIRNRHVDLRALLGEQAREAGVGHVSASIWCTRCDNDRFYSHRAGDAGRQIAVIAAGVSSV